MKYAYLLPFLLFSVALSASPIAICYDNITVALPAGDCEITLEPEWFDGGSYDTGGQSLGFSVSPAVAGLGEHTVYLTVRTRSGSSICWATVRVQDPSPPSLTCHEQNIYLVHPSQGYTINVDDLYTLSDDCGVSNQTINLTDMEGYGTSYFTAYAEHVSGNDLACVNTITVHDAEPQNYCNTSRNSGYEHIRQVGVAGRQFPTGNDGGYRWHYNHSTINLYHGSSYTINYTPGFRGGSAYRLYWRVYLDKNGDGDFTDSGELLHQWNGTGTNAFTFNSPGTFWGMSRIRVVMSYGGYATSCSGRWGEVEDISVMLRPFFFIPWPWGQAVPEMADELASAEVPVTERANDPWMPGETLAPRSPISFGTTPAAPLVSSEAIRLFPNPVATGQPITISGAAGTGEVVIINTAGQHLATRQLTGEATAQRIELPELPAGAYFVRGLATDGGSGWTRRILVR
ncbi:GEVED domain-containing protein [Neolewinella agarilytica]|uniref:Por secretion system C-terminal sorting domain-containing protein n=1 Tax=Neolewinella agarilytica TaxID=478744 RepID=A0A1H9J5Z5_9BACT|nr:GEVED domain-containing protein [Neolewinella agarilytica]SEQ82202.1 Por secretion system C-terminal sorting domain-containing protein [Neolewinella agarilytica]